MLKINDPRKKCIIFLLYYYMFTGLLIDVFHLPRAILYIGDVGNIYLMLSIFKASNYRKKYSYSLLLIFSIYIIVTLISTFLNFSDESLPMYIWGARNNYRFFIFMYACVLFLEKIDVDKILNHFNIIFNINLVVYLVEMLILKVDRDFLGGIFGIVQGCNGRLNLFLCIICAYNLIRFFNKKCSTTWICYIVGISLLMAVFSELKVFFFEVVAILIIIMVGEGISMRFIFIAVAGGIALSFAMTYIATVYDYSRITVDGGSTFFSFENIMNYLTKDSGYTGRGTDLNRLTALTELKKRFFENDIILQSFGIGLGRADYSSFTIFMSDFYKKYSELHYQWFQYAWIYLETGMIGLISYASFFVDGLRLSFKIKDKESSLYKSLAWVTFSLILLSLVYNISMRVESSAYMMFFLMSIPYIILRDKALEDQR